MTVDGAVTTIVRIDISQVGGFGQVVLTADEQGIPALGYAVSYRALQAALDVALARERVAVRYGTRATSVGGTPAFAAVAIDGADSQPLLARIAAVADGGGAFVGNATRRRYEYGQVALVATVTRNIPHAGIAYERFAPEGPIALFPEGNDYGLVWTATPERAQSLLAMDEATFVADLGRQLGKRVAGLTGVSRRRTFPLVLEFSRVPASARCVALGNAAQTLHPVAAQGFNIGLRDAWVLAEIIRDTRREDLGGRAMLARYVGDRRRDRLAGIALTHGLVQLFGSDASFLRWPRGLALTLLDVVPAAKRAFTGAMMFGLR